VVDRLYKVAHHDWNHSHPLDLSDEGLLADLEERAEEAGRLGIVGENGKKKRS
jgi:cardiolipin synthase A/B